jgi:hypothetical protein
MVVRLVHHVDGLRLEWNEGVVEHRCDLARGQFHHLTLVESCYTCALNVA